MRHPDSTTVGTCPNACITIQGSIAFGSLALLASIHWGALSASSDVIDGLSHVIAIQAVWSIISWRVVAESWFDPYSLFLVSAFLFNAGQPLLRALGLTDGELLVDSFSSRTIAETIALVAASLASFHFGALIAAQSGTKAASRTEDSMTEGVNWVGWFMVLLGVFPALYVLWRSLSITSDAGYGGLFESRAATSWAAAPAVLAALVVPGAIFMLAGAQRPTSRRTSAAIIGCWSLIQFQIGSRAWATMPLVAYLWVWHRTVRPFRWHTFACVGLALLCMYPAIAAVRGLSGREKSFSSIREAYFRGESPAVSSVLEMGGTMRTVAHTIELVPDSRGYDWGIGYFYGALTVCPNFFWDVHPTVDRGTASEWLVRTVSPYTAARGGGLGYSFIAEAYLNFGCCGAPLFLFALGWLYAHFVKWSVERSYPGRIAMIASFLAFFLFFPRAESAVVFRPLIWYALLPFLVAARMSAARRIQPPSDSSEDLIELRDSGETIDHDSALHSVVGMSCKPSPDGSGNVPISGENC